MTQIVVKNRFIPILFTVSTASYLSFWSSIGGNPLFGLNDTINLSNLMDKFTVFNLIRYYHRTLLPSMKLPLCHRRYRPFMCSVVICK